MHFLENERLMLARVTHQLRRHGGSNPFESSPGAMLLHSRSILWLKLGKVSLHSPHSPRADRNGLHMWMSATDFLAEIVHAVSLPNIHLNRCSCSPFAARVLLQSRSDCRLYQESDSLSLCSAFGCSSLVHTLTLHSVPSSSDLFPFDWCPSNSAASEMGRTSFVVQPRMHLDLRRTPCLQSPSYRICINCRCVSELILLCWMRRKKMMNWPAGLLAPRAPPSRPHQVLHLTDCAKHWLQPCM
jgi:hypothetical protein